MFLNFCFCFIFIYSPPQNVCDVQGRLDLKWFSANTTYKYRHSGRSYFWIILSFFTWMFGKNKRSKAPFLGFAILITAIVVEDFAWFVNRWLAPLESDPHGGQLMQYSDWTSNHVGAIDVGNFVIPVWYY